MTQKFNLLLLFILFATSSNAAHIIGGYISHECISASNDIARLEVTITVYRDANSGGSEFDSQLAVGIYSKNELDEYEFYDEVTPSFGPITSENFSSVYNLTENLELVSLQKTDYIFQVNIPLDGKDYIISNQRCCRQNSISNLVNPGENGFALELFLSAYGLENCINSVPIVDTPPFTALVNSDETLKFPFVKNDNYSVEYTLQAPNKGGGAFDAFTGDQGCCECIRPEVQNCLPPFESLEYLAPYTPTKPFGETNLYQIDTETGSISGVFTQSGLFSYGINVDQFDGTNLVSQQILDYSLLIDFSPETSLISVQTYIDKNENGSKDSDEKYVDFFDYQLSQAPLKTTIRNQSTIYNVDIGEYDIILNSPNSWEINSATNINVSDLGKTYKVELGIVPSIENQKASVIINAPIFICSNEIAVTIDIHNQGSALFNGELTLTLDQELTFISSDISPTLQSGNELTWNINNNIDLFEKTSITLTVLVPNEDFIDLPMSINSILKNEIGDIVNENAYHDIVRCAFDPNDKLSYSNSHHYYALYGDDLYYTIRFENTGNFRATDVIITDILEPNLDIRTLRLIDASVPVEYSIQGRKLSFIWDNILLPPSEDDPINGNGYVTFKIKPIQGLPENTIIKNSAQIFFDNNTPITTNTARNELVSSLPLTATSDIEREKIITISPNPNKGSFKLNLADHKVSSINISIIDSQGKEVYRNEVRDNDLIDLDLDQGTYYIKVNTQNSLIQKLYPIVVIN